MFLSSIGAPEQSRPAALSWHRGYAVGDHMGDTLKLLHPWWRWWYMMINHGIFGGPQLQTKVCHSLTVFSNLPKIENHARTGKKRPIFHRAFLGCLCGWPLPQVWWGKMCGVNVWSCTPICYQHVWTVYWKVIGANMYVCGINMHAYFESLLTKRYKL